MATERESLEQAIAALEAQRPLLGDAVVEAALAPMREKLAALQAQTPPPPELRGERKLVTVMFADISGFTALSETLDPEAVRDLMNACFEALVPIVEKYGGTVDKFIGDEIMALFGAPITHEDDPARALYAALEMQEQLATFNQQHSTDLGLHFGINTGHVIAGDLGTQDCREYSVMGDAVNVAARLEDASTRGETLVGPDTYRLTAPLFEFAAPEPMAFKGKAEPVPVYRLLKAKPGHRKGRGIAGLSSSLVGRAAEFQALQEAVARLQSGIGGIVTLVGEAGLGKSRLVAELRKSPNLTSPNLQSPHLQWIEGRCLSYGGSIAYLLWLDVLRNFLGVAPDDAPLAVSTTLRELVAAFCPDNFDAVYPYLCRLLSLPLEDRYAMERDLQGESLRAEIFTAVTVLLERAAQQQPVLLVCEDMHWADATSLALLERVLALTDHAPLLLLCVMRPETEHGCWKLKEMAARWYHHRHTDLWLTALSIAESQTLVGNLLCVEALPDALRSRILAHAEGNPFYVEELLRTLIDSHAIEQDAATGQWHATHSVADIALPDTLHGVLSARIDRLQQETKRVLQLAAVIGRMFFYRVLAAIAQEEQQLSTRLLTLQREELIRERARTPELEFVFKHELTREAAYNGLLKQERRAYHRQVAEALERLFPDRAEEQVSLLAYHWEQAEAPEQAIKYLLQAGEQARQSYANEEAIDYYKRALRILDAAEPGETQKDWELEARGALGKIYAATGHAAEAEPYLREAIALGKTIGAATRTMALLYHWLGEVVYFRGRGAERVAIAEEGLALLNPQPESLERALLTQVLAWGYFVQDQNGDRCYDLTLGTTAQFLQRLPYIEELYAAYAHVIAAYLSDDYAGNDVDAAWRWIHILEEKAQAAHDLRGLADAYDMAVCLQQNRGNWKDAHQWSEKALPLHVKIGDELHRLRELGFEGDTAICSGDLSTARQYYEAAKRGLCQVAPENEMVLDMYINLGYLALSENDVAQAEAILQDLLTLQKERNWMYSLFSYYLLGQACRLINNTTAALQQFETALVSMATIQKWRSMQLNALIMTLSALEATFARPEEARTLCARLRAEHPQLDAAPLIQWFLEPGEPCRDADLLFHDAFDAALDPGWNWHDPMGDCAYTVSQGLEIRAANGRTLWGLNRSAPCLLRAASGNVALQTVCVPATNDCPAMGGLLLWQGDDNYLQLVWGMVGPRDITLIGVTDKKIPVAARGRLPGSGTPEHVWLRLEWREGQVVALCSADGQQWFSVGRVAFPATGSCQAGLYAIGDINRVVYPGAYPDGTAIRFTEFHLWSME